MLAATIKDISTLTFPLYASPKLDGIRGVVINGILRSRSLKTIPNQFVSDRFSQDTFNGLDGELILGSPTAKDVYRQSNGACARHTGTPDIKFHVFDHFSYPDWSYQQRWVDRKGMIDKNIVVMEQTLIETCIGLITFENDCLEMGYEGVILRSPDGGYKFGRSTLREQGMMKLKRFVDSEAVILEVIEEQENTNVKKTNELGRSKRSSHKAGKHGKGTAGGFRVRDVTSGVEFDIGSGLTDEDGQYYWKHKLEIESRGDIVIKYKSFMIGVKDKPRHPVYLGPREAWDMS